MFDHAGCRAQENEPYFNDNGRADHSERKTEGKRIVPFVGYTPYGAKAALDGMARRCREVPKRNSHLGNISNGFFVYLPPLEAILQDKISRHAGMLVIYFHPGGNRT